MRFVIPSVLALLVPIDPEEHVHQDPRGLVLLEHGTVVTNTLLR
jgi:hypothetical protein